MSTSSSMAGARSRREAGWLFAASFRPLFIAASALAAASVPIWVHLYLTGGTEIAGLPAMVWHAHEMVFGFLPAVMTGYLLSATPNWSGRLPASGWPLAGLVFIWLAGRILPFAGGTTLALLADATFPAVVTVVLLREARVRSPRQARIGLALFPVLAFAAVGHRLLAAAPDLAALASRAGIGIAATLITVVGGRLVPSLTRNLLAGAGSDRLPATRVRLEAAVLVVTPLAAVAWTLDPVHQASGLLLAGCAVLQAIRLAGWRGWRVRQADVLYLHAGYAWLAIAPALASLSFRGVERMPADMALHAFTAGAIGTMTMAVMARLSATRGAGGRSSERLCGLALLLVNLSALVRVSAPLAADVGPAMAAAAALWTGAWSIFLLGQILPAVGRLSNSKRSM